MKPQFVPWSRGLFLALLALLAGPQHTWPGDPQSMAAWHRQYPAEQFLVGAGQGDYSKGRLTCLRVSEVAARADIAKQIRVLIKERAVDRIRERSGGPVEQDIEVIREESVNEYLQDVKIVDQRVDESAGACSSIAVMARSRISAKPGLPNEESAAKP